MKVSLRSNGLGLLALRSFLLPRLKLPGGDLIAHRGYGVVADLANQVHEAEGIRGWRGLLVLLGHNSVEIRSSRPVLAEQFGLEEDGLDGGVLEVGRVAVMLENTFNGYADRGPG
jgi:hypothetical protein